MFFPPTFAPIISSGGASPAPFSGHKYFDVDDRTSDGWSIPSGSGYVSGGRWYATTNLNQIIWSPSFSWASGKKIRAFFPAIPLGGFVELQWDLTLPSNMGVTITNTDGSYRAYVGGSLVATFGTGYGDGSLGLELEIQSATSALITVLKTASVGVWAGALEYGPSLSTFFTPGADRFIVKIKSPASGGDTACEQVDFSI